MGPLTTLIDNSVDQLLAEYGELEDDLAIVGLVQAAVMHGIELANTRLGDLV